MYMPYGFGMYNGSYLLFFCAIPIILGLIASGVAKSRLSKYSQIANSINLTGAQAAQQMLAFHNVTGVDFYRGGSDQDFFNPKNNSITLSPEYFSQPSIAAIAVACHEAGHACQHASGYFPIKVRGALVPVVNLASNAWMIILLLGIFFNMAGLAQIAVIVFAITLLFHLVTLPVEFNASRRGIAYLKTLALDASEMRAAKRILRGCAFTYVVAALISALQLI